ncbi:MAG: response regulator transcription factor [Armatimonadetes bacterium]|nr:response regulator transcription factor [Armatimonadota bacterium]
MSIIKLLVIDEHLVIREGLAVMLASYPDLQLIGTCGSTLEAFEFLTHTVPDVILMDIKIGGKNGLEATREIKARFPDIKILILTIYEDMDSVRLSLQAGATGYILIDVSQEELVESIRRIYQGEVVIDSAVFTQFKKRVGSKSGELTMRESEVLKYLAQGLTNKEISIKTHLATATIKTNRRNIYRKLGVKKNRSQVINFLVSKSR